MEGTVAGVRIVPPVVEFFDAETDVLHQMNLTVQNLSKSSKSIRFHGPSTNSFRLKAINPDRAIAPGLEVSALVEYFSTKAKDSQDRVILVVDNDVVEIPLVAYTPAAQLELSGPADFGVSVANGKVIFQEVDVYNTGSQSGEFRIRYSGKLPITIMPTAGVVKPGSRQPVKIEFISKTPGKFHEVANVRLEGQPPTVLEIKGHVVERSLDLLSIDTLENVKCINFGCTYYGTDKIESFLIHNNGPDVARFVAILEEGGEGQEMGVDLTKSASAILSSQHAVDELGTSNELTSLVTALPSQGTLQPNEMKVVHFKFSPRFSKSNKGWKTKDEPLPRRDYALFMHIETVGSAVGASSKEGSRVEVAVMGTALPVLVSVSPSPVFKFGDCPVGEQIDCLCTINNESASLPMAFSLQRVAHFQAQPVKGSIKAGQSMDVVLSFRPNQMGTFKSALPLDVLGTVAEDFSSDSDPTVMRYVTIYTTSLQLVGISSLPDSKKGLDKRPKSSDAIAHPDDRATSMRPANRKEKIRTLFTNTERYTYVDPDYALTDEEEKKRTDHKNKYLDYIDSLRKLRIANEKSTEFSELNDKIEMGMKPAHGLRPPKLSSKEIKTLERSTSPIKDEVKLLNSKALDADRSSMTLKKISDGLNAVPMTTREKNDCSKVLTPQQLKLLEIGPSAVDFGQVCLRSVSCKDLMISNKLDIYVLMEVQIDCRELRQTSPLSQVVPSRSLAKLGLMFESNSKGKFERSVKYRINGSHEQHVVVTAEVVPVDLQLSNDEITLKPCPGMPADEGLRSNITIYNKRNYPAEFTWAPVVDEKGTAFSIRPRQGTVEAFTNLECEVVYHPSYSAPADTLFVLQVTGGSEKKLACKAEVGSTHCSFVERRLLFGPVPINLVTTKVVSLKNTSQNHAYFEVVNTLPIPGMVISPKESVVPVGGTAELKVEFSPDYIHKFDTQIEVSVRGWKTIFLRVGGTVEPPCVEIDVDSFKFGGVHCGALAKIDFKMNNMAKTKADMVIDLSRFRDFSLKFLENDDFTDEQTIEQDGIHFVTLTGQQTKSCALEFNPSEVASYDFVIPVMINNTIAPGAPSSVFPPTPAPSKTNWTISELATPAPSVAETGTPCRRVRATALRPPLQLSHTTLEFNLPSGYFELGIESGAGRAQGFMFVNNSDQTLSWTLHTKAGGPLLEDGTFKFLHRSGSPMTPTSAKRKSVIPEITLDSGETFQLGVLFTPPRPGLYTTSVPVILNGNRDVPYRMLQMKGELLAPGLTFDPERLHLPSVPLNTPVSAQFNIIARGYRRATTVRCEVPEVELEDGSSATVLSVAFLDGQTIRPCCVESKDEEPCVIPCKITFQSRSPVSFSTALTFVDGRDNHELQVTATADNCLLTNFHFIASHQDDFHIICDVNQVSIRDKKTDQIIQAGEATFLPCVTPNRPSTIASTSATSTTFGVSSSSYQESSNGATSSTYPSTPHHEGHGPSGHLALEDDDSESSDDNDTYSLEFGGETADKKFIYKVMLAVQRWFSTQGWAGGPYPIVIPETLRSALQDTSEPPSKGTTRTTNWDSNARKETRSILDLMTHLCGRPVPGIPVANTLPTDPEERVRHIHWMYSTLLTFLKAQGAMVASVKPEYLLDTRDYQRWQRIRERLEEQENPNGALADRTKQKNKRKEAIKFESLSRRAWTDILAQLVKILILSRITPQQFKKIQTADKNFPLPEVNPDPLCSNVYSVGERIILVWINYHYEVQRRKPWPESIDGTSPPRRWIVNFDYDFIDGLVLAALMTSHVPFLKSTHLHSMYTHPNTAEQCLHNVLKVVDALKHIGIDYDVQATDITEPNPITVLLLCIHLYRRLPQYLPRTTVEFHGPLNASVTKEVRLQNPSSKPLVYQVILAGKDAVDFKVPMGETVQVSSKGQLQLPVEFKSRFLRPCSAVLVLVGRRAGSACGNTLVFTLETCINNITPVATIKCESTCYELENVDFDVTNPFPVKGEFRIVLVEAKSAFPTSSPPRTRQSKPKKVVGARTDHGQSKKSRSPRREPLPKIEPESTQEPSTTNSSPMFNSFWSSTESVYLDANGTATVEIQFLPFSVGHRQCSVLFINENIGEFLYSIEGNSLLPLPSTLPHAPSSRSVRISSAAAARSARGVFGGDERVVYWKCESNETFTEDLYIPLNNAVREKALVVAAQQRMSDREIRRRQLTGTLSSGTVTAGMLATMGGHVGGKFINAGDMDAVKNLNRDSTRFQVECSSKFYSTPSYLTIPTSSTRSSDILKDAVRMPVTFKPGGPGHYPCQIVLRSPYDIRVYQVESTVSPEGSALELHFTTPTHQSVTQDIPVVNHSQQDWHLSATLEGEGFFGPPVIFAKALVTTYYPVMFRPSYERDVEGKLTLTNKNDGTEQIVKLKGTGHKPLPLDQLLIECQAGESVTQVLQVPNVTKNKLTFKVMCDLNIISGPSAVTVLPGQTGEHMITVSPWRRGKFAGVISFIALSRAVESTSDKRLSDSDSDDDTDFKIPTKSSTVIGSEPSSSPVSQGEVDQTPPYRLWYSIEVQASPPPPARTIEVSCAAHSAAFVDIPVPNPSRENVTIDVSIEGTGLEGEPTVAVDPRQEALYQLKFSPTSIGESKGSITFQHELIGELWYDLVLKAVTPVASPLPMVNCALGSSTYQMIKLRNPTDHNLLLTPSCSNTRNFSLELDSSRQLLLGARATIEVPLKFTPSKIGHGNHSAEIVFHSDELGDWVFLASGTGMTPQPADPINIYSELGGNSSIIIPFRNPTDDEVVVDVVMKERSLSRMGVFGSMRDETKAKESAFCLLLKHTNGISLAPNGILDIPISFAPDTMQQHDASVTVSLRKQDGDDWNSGSYTGLVTSSLVSGLSWIFPVKGIPESRPVKESQAPCIECRARSRVEERVEVSLTGVAAHTMDAGYASYVRALTPIHILGHKSISDTDLGLDHINVPEEFRYELEYSDSESHSAIERSLGLSLVRKMKNQVSGVISLVFNFVFAPYKPFSHSVQLVVSAASGGVWRFPIRLVATEPEVDDTICIDAAGLNKDSTVGFKLNSQTSLSVPFEAYFVPGSDAEFAVTPSSGRLLAIGSEGTLIKIRYKPSIYGKTHRAKLVIQTSDMQWTYDVIGKTPEYAPPTAQSVVGSTGHAHRRTVKQKKNYVRENLKLQNTAVSSPVKGVPLVSRSVKSAHQD